MPAPSEQGVTGGSRRVSGDQDRLPWQQEWTEASLTPEWHDAMDRLLGASRTGHEETTGRAETAPVGFATHSSRRLGDPGEPRRGSPRLR